MLVTSIFQNASFPAGRITSDVHGPAPSAAQSAGESEPQTCLTILTGGDDDVPLPGGRVEDVGEAVVAECRETTVVDVVEGAIVVVVAADEGGTTTLVDVELGAPGDVGAGAVEVVGLVR
ncbi:MAG TPA: hypothetical protein VMD59_11045 [Acidimicrobiales bacterium]|nr:hypothetical protein [Acidimicrobiales bacterium]